MEKNRFVQLVADMLYRTDRESLNLETRYKVWKSGIFI